MKKLLALVCVAAVASVASANLLSEDFEAYADTAAMEAVWGDQASTLVDTGSNKYMEHPGGTVNSQEFAAYLPTDAAPLMVSVDVIDDGAGNKRVTTGIRDNGAGAGLTALIELGRYNSFSTGSGYGVRLIGLGSVDLYGNPNWVQFEDINNPGTYLGGAAGTHEITATFGATFATATIDLDKDGQLDGQLNFTGTDPGVAWNIARLGGPSNLSSAGGPLGFDNLAITPEPASLMLLALAGLALRRR